jgi:hypothetical protein
VTEVAVDSVQGEITIKHILPIDETLPLHSRGHAPSVGVEFAIPYTLWTEPQPPQFLGAPFQPEDEFGVFALHAWVWRQNPNGLFTETNPRVSCAR